MPHARNARSSADQVAAAAALRGRGGDASPRGGARRLREAMVHVVIAVALDGLRSREQAFDGYAEGITTVMASSRPAVVSSSTLSTSPTETRARGGRGARRPACAVRSSSGPGCGGFSPTDLRAVGEGRVSPGAGRSSSRGVARPELPAVSSCSVSGSVCAADHEDLRAALFRLGGAAPTISAPSVRGASTTRGSAGRPALAT